MNLIKIEKKLEEKILSFCSKNKIFTSIDLSNELKQDGTWCSVTNTAKFLNQYIKKSKMVDEQNNQYIVTKVDIDGKSVSVYHPANELADKYEYITKPLHAITPQEFETMFPNPIDNKTELATDKDQSLNNAEPDKSQEFKKRAKIFYWPK